MRGRSIRLTDAQWAKIKPHLRRPRRSRRGGRPRVSNRDAVDGILWVLKTGTRWRDLPDGYPSGATCWRRLRQWDEDGTWRRLWRAFLGQLAARGRLRWEQTFRRSSTAHLRRPKRGLRRRKNQAGQGLEVHGGPAAHRRPRLRQRCAARPVGAARDHRHRASRIPDPRIVESLHRRILESIRRFQDQGLKDSGIRDSRIQRSGIQGFSDQGFTMSDQ